MSIRVMDRVWSYSQAKGIDRLVLLAIADHASDDGSNAWPSIATLARKTGVSGRTVQRSIQRLVEMGELSYKSPNGKTHQFRVLIKGVTDSHPRQSVTPDTVPPPTDSHPRQAVTPDTVSPEGWQPVTPGGDAVSPEPSLEPTTEPSIEPSSSAAARADVERICTHLADRIVANGSKRPTITKTGWLDPARLLIDLDDRTEEQVHKAIDWSQQDEFWRSNILSVKKLRAQYDQLRLAAQRKNGNGASPPTGPNADVQRMQALNRMGRTPAA